MTYGVVRAFQVIVNTLESSPEKAGVGGSTPSLATILSITCVPHQSPILSHSVPNFQACPGKLPHSFSGSVWHGFLIGNMLFAELIPFWCAPVFIVERTSNNGQ